MTKFGALAVALFAAVVALIVASSARWPAPTPAPPRRPEPVIVVVDAGHGGHDPGAIVHGVQEKRIALELALRVSELAGEEPWIEILLTRSGDYYVDLRERVGMAEREGAAMYISIHANANASTTICGAETWVHESVRPGDVSWKLAEVIQRNLVNATGATDRGVLRQPLYLRHTDLPAVLVEVGYLTCPREHQLLQNPEYKERIAEGIWRGIVEFVR